MNPLRLIRDLIRRKFFNGKLVSRGAKLSNSKLEEFVQVTDRANVVSSCIGRYTSIGRNTNIYFATVGNFCSISWNVTIGAPSHPMNRMTSHAFPYIKLFGFVKKDKKVRPLTKVGHDVWIGANSIILPGLNIGSGSVIGAGTIVTKDIPPYSIVVGNPGRIIKKRFDNKLIEHLETLCWWEWDKKKIAKNIHLFQEEFSEKLLTLLIK